MPVTTMRTILVGTAFLVTLAGCTPRPERASQPTFSWQTEAAPPPAPPVDPSSPVGEWTGELPSADGAGRTFALTIDAQGRFWLETMALKTGADRKLESGIWSATRKAITLEISRANGREVVGFLGYDLRDSLLVPTEGWDTTTWGSVGPPVLRRQ